MPVVIVRSSLEIGRRATGLPGARTADSRAVDVALINNMPDKALEATERQFVRLLAAASRGLLVRVKFYSLPDMPRTDRGRRLLSSSYASMAELWNDRCDGIVVTGTEPRAPDLSDEPYWLPLSDLIDWTERNTVSSVWSCLAAHAAVLHRDGIARRPLADKRFGVFTFDKVADHPVMAGLPSQLQIPHSRWNELPEEALAACGYEVLTRSSSAGVDTFAKPGKAPSIFFQGHPEYDADTLLREFRRDMGRFLKGEREACPAIPEGLEQPTTQELLTSFRERAIRDRREAVMSSFPAVAASASVTNTWRLPAIRLYRNWLMELAARKAERVTFVPIGTPRARLSP